MLKFIETIIVATKRNGKNVGTYGQQLSTCPEMIVIMIISDVDSITVAIDNFMTTFAAIQRYQQVLGLKIG